MSRLIRRIHPVAWLMCGIGIWLATFVTVRARTPIAQAAPAAAVQQAPASPAAPATPAVPKPPPTGPATFVGDKACLDCHDTYKRGIEGSPHSRAMDPRSPAAKQGCETCHGAGSRHAEDTSIPVKIFSKMSPREVTATCATCHNRGEHALWDGSQHDARGLTCTTCHSVHDPKSEAGQLKAKTQPQLCATCHRDKVAKLDRSGHMPVREGKMECSTCHSPHGATNVKLLRKGDSVGELCTSCHADKRGPFLWEHAPGRDGCVTCHDPHGSSNERMLVAKPPILCQRCHVGTRHPSTIYDGALVGAGASPSVRVYGRSCVTCHVNIHGSNHPSGQRFIR
ncbi:MAG: DmsE family decaheme c-type cytochrome [Acidobacteriota bacterium]